MRIPVVIVAASLAMTACSSIGGKTLAVCDSKHLRPANPYGTVLAPSAEGSPEERPKTLSSAASPKSFGSCA